MLGTLSVLSFCYRDLFARWEIRTEQPSMSFHYVTVGRGGSVTLRYRFLFVFYMCRCTKPLTNYFYVFWRLFT